MKILITAGPTREYIDSVRYISNASSGLMGFAVAAAAVAAGHDVTLLVGPGLADPPAGVVVVPFVSVADLQAGLDEHFDDCDALVMAAAVGDFHVANPAETKLSRKAGPVTIELLPTEDLLAGVAGRKRPGQTVVAFAVEDGTPEEIQAKARAELAAKRADFSVVNTPEAMGAAASLACILTAETILLPWAHREKRELARHIIKLLEAERQ
ncbi:MAG: hypothetical protein K8S55_05285 [Phycisphaerae bacterium]|nr:hypothetical protein [Phycisphaerae bacterium]